MMVPSGTQVTDKELTRPNVWTKPCCGISNSTEKLLRDHDLPSTVAHALLGRTVFVKYLEDRGILLPDHLLPHGQAREFKELLGDENGTRSYFQLVAPDL